MGKPLTVFRRTWLPTVLFLVVATFIWWIEGGWNSAKGTFVPTIVLCPPVWWWIVSRKNYPRIVRGLVAGALIGPLTQVFPYAAPTLWYSVMHPWRAGEGGLAAGVVNAFFILVAIGSAVIGASIGLVAVLIQRRADKPTSPVASSDSAGGSRAA